jgi:hypothetical protein
MGWIEPTPFGRAPHPRHVSCKKEEEKVMKNFFCSLVLALCLGILLSACSHLRIDYEFNTGETFADIQNTLFSWRSSPKPAVAVDRLALCDLSNFDYYSRVLLFFKFCA